MRLLTIFFAALVFGQSACAANAGLDSKEMLWWEATATACGNAYQHYVALGVQSWLDGLDAEMIEKARQSGANPAQIEVIQGHYVEGLKFAALRGWTRQRVFAWVPSISDDYVKRLWERLVVDIRALCVEDAPRSQVLQRTPWAIPE